MLDISKPYTLNQHGTNKKGDAWKLMYNISGINPGENVRSQETFSTIKLILACPGYFVERFYVENRIHVFAFIE